MFEIDVRNVGEVESIRFSNDAYIDMTRVDGITIKYDDEEIFIHLDEIENLELAIKKAKELKGL